MHLFPTRVSPWSALLVSACLVASSTSLLAAGQLGVSQSGCLRFHIPTNRATARFGTGRLCYDQRAPPCDSDFLRLRFQTLLEQSGFLESRVDSSFKTSGHIATVTTAMNNALRRANKRQRNEQAAARVSAGGARRTTARGEARAGACRRARGAAACGRRKIVRGRRLVGREGRHDVARLGAWDRRAKGRRTLISCPV